uniref:Uncharacterized protein n=1 Tax=Tanacetum cinerariifolium TaxID=118510 RepID=A0A699IF75_TANCI|nr:hypothetical protein [Tanacetum cinerariifolium]
MGTPTQYLWIYWIGWVRMSSIFEMFGSDGYAYLILKLLERMGCKVMRTLASVEIVVMLILGLPCCLCSSSVRCLEGRVPPRLTELRAPECPYHCRRILMRLVYLVGTDTESEPFEGKARTHESPHIVAPPTCHVEGSSTSGVRSTSSDFTAPLSPDHPLTHTTPVLVPILRRTAHMAMRVPPVMSPGLSAGIDSEEDEEVEESSDSDSESEDVEDEGPTAEDEDPAAEDKGLAARVEGPILDEESYGLDNESHGVDGKSYGLDDESHGIDDEDHSIESDGLGLGEEEAVPEGQERAVLVVGTAVSEPLGFGYGALRCRELELEEDHVYNTFEVGHGSGSAPKPERSERVSAFRQPTLTQWIDPEDDMIYIDVPVYPPPTPRVQTPP